MLLISAVLSLALAADPPRANATMKSLLQEALVAPVQPEDGGAALQNGIDVTKLPFSADSVKRIVMSFQPQMQSCYEETLAAIKNPKVKAVEGSLKTHFVITGEGQVRGARVEKKGSSLKDARLHDCVVAVLSSMVFPKPPAGKDQPIDFPFNLKAVK
jgi:hypothetical protein